MDFCCTVLDNCYARGRLHHIGPGGGEDSSVVKVDSDYEERGRTQTTKTLPNYKARIRWSETESS